MWQMLHPTGVMVMFVTYAILHYQCDGAVQGASTTHVMPNKIGLAFVDLSYLTHLDAKDINQILHDNIQNEIGSNRETRHIKIDVSSSGLGDSGILDMIESCLVVAENNKDNRGNDKDNVGHLSSPLYVSLEARMNNISPMGASSLFDRIIAFQNQTASSGEIEIKGSETYKENVKDNHNQELYKEKSRNIFIESLDLGFNDIGHGTGDKKEIHAFHKSLKRLIENQVGCCPRVLRLDVCGLGAPSCRAIGKGLIDREEHVLNKPNQSMLRELYLGGNDAIGDGGLAALAAALKTITKDHHRGGSKQDKVAILHHLDVSCCGIGDAGVEAIAIAIDSNPGGCIKHLDLSNNQVTDEGAIALSRALMDGHQKLNDFCLDSLDLSNNHGIGDEGAMALFEALECGALRSLSLRSCSVKWRGAAALGTTLANIALEYCSDQSSLCKSKRIEVDISGNHIGKKEPKKKSSVHENVMNGMTFLSKRIKSSLKDAGLNSLVGSSLESDDEVEMMDDSLGSELEMEESTSSRCGASEFYNNLCDGIEDATVKQQGQSHLQIKAGMRMCNFDERGIQALCASCVVLGDKLLGVRLQVDCTLNDEACDDEDVVVAALKKGDVDNLSLREMADRHHDLLNRYEDFDDYGYDNDY